MFYWILVAAIFIVILVAMRKGAFPKIRLWVGKFIGIEIDLNPDRENKGT